MSFLSALLRSANAQQLHRRTPRRVIEPIVAALLFFPTPAWAQLFAPAVNYSTGSYPAAIAVADFNGDGKLDVAVTNVSSASVSTFLGQGDGTLRRDATSAASWLAAPEGHAATFGGGIQCSRMACHFSAPGAP